MASNGLPTAGGLAYREAGPADAPVVLLVHGWPESSWMWRHTIDALAAAGLRAIAPDLAGYGDSPLRRPATWAMHREALEEFRQAVGLEHLGLAVHDWGGLIGLRWACDHPGVVRAMSISDTGFFPDGKWHDLAATMRTPGEGEAIIELFDREAFGSSLRAFSPGMDDADLDEYYRPFTTPEGRAAQLELYRSGEFSELVPYEGELAALNVPTLILWGADDAFARVASAHRFKKEIPRAELELLDGVGHFAPDDAPEEFSRRVVAFFSRTMLGR